MRNALTSSVHSYLDTRRPLATRLHVVAPYAAPVAVEALIARRADMPADRLQTTVAQALQTFLDRLEGGPGGAGWPFGQAIYCSELYRLLEAIPGVDYVPDIELISACRPPQATCVPAGELLHPNGDLIGLGLAAHHLPLANVSRAQIVVGEQFVPVRVELRVSPTGPGQPERALRAAKLAVKRRFHPLHGGPDGTRDETIVTHEMLRRAVERGGALTVREIKLHCQSKDATTGGARFARRELADVEVYVALEESA